MPATDAGAPSTAPGTAVSATGTAAAPLLVVDRVSRRYRVRATGGSAAAEARHGRRSIRRRPTRGSTVTVPAVNELSLVVDHGEAVGVIGRNGSGKSTLMRMISGRERPTTGSVHASSTPVMLGVNAALMPTLSGEQNIILGGLAMGLSRQEVEERYDAVVDLSGLDSAIYRPLETYSSGMASRLQFAIATSVNPEILIVDEALNTGDAQFGDRSKARMDELRAQAGCVLLVSHSIPTVREMCTRVVWLDQGDLIMDGEPGVVTQAYVAFARALAQDEPETAERIRSDARRDLVMPTVTATPPPRRGGR
ncbi:hypothetical protein GCM10011512_16190 [Tersicoccus solisilvae]|uniref:ABC transporter domain-containing protein n=1 Tax=Tersicoccus solisilvae TaxID=1882339 RepID=A0ABQ1P2Z4_9MICC|nr:ABC transporter ATP-binding protein [Tersicoccus solisilvae]GGC89985.1 hypothetical protein GCM10011512_16190 [Tersicoccus solisilvae]